MCSMRNVESALRTESGPICNFYTGKNPPERKDYMVDKFFALAHSPASNR